MVELKNVNFKYGSKMESMSNDLSDTDTPSVPEKTGSGNLTDINLTIDAGEFVLLTGPSGCGKTTILRLLNGLIPKYYSGELSGKIEIDHESIENKELYQIANKVGTVFQNPKSQFFNVDTTSELAFGCENQGMDPEAIRQRIAYTVNNFQMENLMDRNIFKISGGEKQKIACASIDVGRPDLILLDEPSANLDYNSMMQLRELMRIWKQEGKTILVAEHRISYLWDSIDHVVMMKSGEIIRDISSRAHMNLSSEELISLGLRSTKLENPSDINLPSVESKKDTLLLENFSFSYKQGWFERKSQVKEIFNIDKIEIPTEKITAIIGSNGSGKTTLLNCLCGLEKNTGGAMYYHNKPLHSRQRQDTAFMVMQDTNHQLFTESVIEEIIISLPNSKKDGTQEKDAEDILSKLNLLEYKDRHPMSLSGGQKQRLAIACAIASKREILLFDEPTSGLDYVNMKQTASILQELKDMGMTILVVTHDCELIQSCCDYKIVLKEGTVNGF